MKIPISDIPDEGIEIDLLSVIQADEFRTLSPVKSSLKIDKVGSELLARGVLSVEVELQCARCLRQFPLRISSQLNVVYHSADELGRHEQHELKSEELDTVFYKDDILETDDLLKDQLILNLQMKPLCSSDCRGFCPVCGADMNISACGCEAKEIDPRFEILKKLKTEKEQ